ncbi:MAG: hypothetical protein F4W92_06420 [Gammaproteobacteria bacterium]|nr:hypothetical protein [Gammaproteobacteria bacterium]
MRKSILPKLLVSYKTLLVGVLVGTCLSVASCIGIAAFLSSPTTSFAPDKNVGETVSGSDPVSRVNRSGSLEELVNIESPSQRRKELYSYLDGKNSDELVRLIDDFDLTRNEPRRALVQNFLFEQLTKLDPNRALSHVWRQADHRWDDLLFIVFGKWATTNVEAALEATSTLESRFKSNAVQAILIRRTDLTDSERSEIAQILENDFKTNMVLSETRILQLLNRPKDAWNMLLNDRVSNDAQADLFVQVASAWISLNGVDGYVPVFQSLCALDESYRHKLTNSVVRRIVVANPQLAWEQAQNLSTKEQHWINPQIMKIWGSIDQHTAFKLASQIHDPEIQHASFKSLIDGWSSAQPTDVLNELQVIPPEYRNDAITSAIHQLARNQSFDEATKYIQDLAEQGESVSRATRDLIDIWSTHDPVSAFNWLIANTEADSTHSRVALFSVFDNLALQNPSQAMEFARTTEFPDTPSVAIKRSVMTALASSGRFESAREILDEFQEPLDLYAYQTLGRNLIEFDRGIEAIELAEDLPESRWIEYFRILSLTWFTSKPDELVDNMELLPSKAVQSIVAQQMLSSASSDDYVLSSEQVEHLQTFLEVEE